MISKRVNREFIFIVFILGVIIGGVLMGVILEDFKTPDEKKVQYYTKELICEPVEE